MVLLYEKKGKIYTRNCTRLLLPLGPDRLRIRVLYITSLTFISQSTLITIFFKEISLNQTGLPTDVRAIAFGDSVSPGEVGGKVKLMSNILAQAS